MIIPNDFNVMGTLGSTILANEAVLESNKATVFIGFDILQQNYKLRRVVRIVQMNVNLLK
jgi:hypothetical protein